MRNTWCLFTSPSHFLLSGCCSIFLRNRQSTACWVLQLYYNFFVAAIATIPVVFTGLVAWRWALEGQRLKGVLLMHLVFGCLSSVLLWIVWLIHKKSQRNREALPGYRLPIEVVAVATVTVTGHLGGFLSGVNGPG
jgi:uncharacterized membrane protein